jgi:spoIIIJ-associated protein
MTHVLLFARDQADQDSVASGLIDEGFSVTTADDPDLALKLVAEGDVDLVLLDSPLATGADLGLLIGPKGQTLQAVQELARSVLQRRAPGEAHARIRVDVGGYRERRREALARFVTDIAAQVKESGVKKALEPMSPPDRKVVHDTVNEIEGVTTISEGEEQRRRVVILPE